MIPSEPSRVPSYLTSANRRSSWANLRRKNTGKDEPHAVKYWGLGNESKSAFLPKMRFESDFCCSVGSMASRQPSPFRVREESKAMGACPQAS